MTPSGIARFDTSEVDLKSDYMMQHMHSCIRESFLYSVPIADIPESF